LIFYQGFEQVERTLLWRYLRTGDVFVDVGANLGLFTVIAAKRVGDGGRVYAFEPAAQPRQRLEENVRLNRFGNVSILPLALSDEAGLLEISVPTDGYDAWSSLAAPIAGTGIRVNRVEAVTWDDFARSGGDLKPTMMKIDVEGWENRVLDGASAMLSAIDAPLLQVEFTDAAASSAGSSCAALYQHLLDFGYTVCRYDRVRNQLVPDALRASYPYDNLYATKRLARDNQRLRGRAFHRFPPEQATFNGVG
ncbi:MAG: FkbM family methyltransferase, partial [Chromatiaceae bacterium]